MPESYDVGRTAYKTDSELFDALNELLPLLTRCSQLSSDVRIHALVHRDIVDGLLSRHSHQESLADGSLAVDDVAWYSRLSGKALLGARDAIDDLDDAIEALARLVERLDNLEGAFDDLYSHDE